MSNKYQDEKLQKTGIDELDRIIGGFRAGEIPAIMPRMPENLIRQQKL